MKPTHNVKTLDGTRYACDLSDPDDFALLSKAMQEHGTGIIRLTHLVEDPNWQSEKRYTEKVAIVTTRSLCGIEEL
jgi:hypothetical protein